MANLDAGRKKIWKSALRSCESPWVLFGVNASNPSLAEKLNGMAGLIDWYLHGQISNLLIRGRVSPGEFCLVPGANGKNNFLLFHHTPTLEAKPLLLQLQQLGVKSLCLAQSTFPEDFSSKVKQTLTKAGISCTTLEPETK